jgi:DNA polymerase elongation subunit (family B)
MLSTLWQLVDEADAMLTYNGKKFDRPRLNTVFALSGFEPPSPTTDIDLYETIRRESQFPSSSLDYVSKQFGLGGKVPNSGYDLWRRCMLRDPKAWEEMRTYCIGDVMLTEELYFKVLPWIKRHPSLAAMTGDSLCINCGSDHLIKKGYGYTLSRAYQRLRCADCGKPQRSSRSVPGITAPVVEG